MYEKYIIIGMPGSKISGKFIFTIFNHRFTLFLNQYNSSLSELQEQTEEITKIFERGFQKQLWET
jgi:hypothetical protein